MMTLSNSHQHQQSRYSSTALCGVILAIMICSPLATAQQTDIESQVSEETDVTFAAMPLDQVQTQLMQWIASRNLPKTSTQKAMKRWAAHTQGQDLTSEQLLDAAILSFAEIDADANTLLQQSVGEDFTSAIETAGQLNFYAAQVQLFRARWLVQHRFYDDALETLKDLNPDEVIDPASLMFYRAICQSELLQTEEALASISLLQNNTLNPPHRFLVVADMLKKELIERENEGMRNVAELMQDVERRLDIGQSGEQTQTQEDAVIAALDKLLEDLEEQQQQQQQQQQQSGQGQGQQQQQQQQANPLQESRVKNGASGNGDADAKNLTETGQWGLLNSKQEAKAREMIQQKFPSNFIDQIGRYNRKIAEQKK